MSEEFRARGYRVTNVHVEGRFHSAVHSSTVDKLTKFASNTGDLHFPGVDKLLVPVRSAINGEIITGESLVRVALENTLSKPVNWYGTLQAAVAQLAKDNLKIAAFAGSGNHIPASLACGSGLQILSLGGTFTTGSNLTSGIIPTPDHGFVNGASVDSTSVNGRNLEYPSHSIAIVGMAGRFPGADSLDEFWELLLSGESMSQPAPVDRLRLPETGEHAGTKWWGNFLNDPDTFDHRFFKKSSREAIAWDPQQRILLEVVYEALESAGYFGAGSKREPEDYGCYIGAVMNNYYDNVSCHPATAYATLGTSRCFLSGCMSHQFGWTGPSLTIDTACSSSLVAIDTACRAIRSGQCSRAIAGGTNMISSPFDYQNLHAAGFLSPSGQCKPFDADADGYCRGEGVGVIVLKRLEDALDENDNILGVIVGSAANQNHNLSHITVPHSGSQINLYRNVMSAAGVDPKSVSYVEAHGTGTGVGDPVECRSIREAFAGASRETNLHFGSVKGNIGHTEATAGIAGLIKVLLMMQHGKIPAQASHKSLNPKIPALGPDKMVIPKSIVSWNPPTRIAMVNSYGAAGSNSAALIRQYEWKAIKPVASQLSKYPLFISAASTGSLSMYSQKLTSWLQHLQSKETMIQLSDLAFNLSDRANHSLTSVFTTIVADMNELEQQLNSIASGTAVTAVPSPKPIILVFGGQESDFVGLSEELYWSSTLLRHHLDSCNDLLLKLGYNGLYPAIFQRTAISDLITLHSALFSIQYSSAKSWIDSGLEVSAVVGHSFGQLTALCISGTLSLEDALKLVAGRASIILKHWGSEAGSMIFLQTDESTVSEILTTLKAQGQGQSVEIACYNGPKSHVVVGTSRDIDALESVVTNTISYRTSVRMKRLQVTHGFHSQFTERLLPHLKALAQSLEWQHPTIYLETCDEVQSISKPDYRLVADHTRRPVFFQSAVERLATKFPQITWLEAGRGSSVTQLVRGCVTEGPGHSFLSPQLTTPNAQDSLAKVTVDLWKAGYSVQYWPFHRMQKNEYRHLSLPPYQFEKTRHWLPFTGRMDQKVEVSAPIAETPTKHELLSFLRFKDNSKTESIFNIAPQSDRFKSMLGGHVMAGQALAPASLYFEVAARAALYLAEDIEGTIYVPTTEDLIMKSPIGLDANIEILLCLKRLDPSHLSWSFSITTQAKGTLHSSSPFEQSTGRVYLTKRDNAEAAQIFKRFETLTGFRRCNEIMNHPDAEKMSGKHVYRAFNHIVHYGENFRGIKEVSCVGFEATGKVMISIDPNDPPDQRLTDTPMTDSFMQFAGFLVNYFNNPSLENVLVCSKIERIEIGGGFDPDAKEWVVYSNMSQEGDSDALADAYIFEAKSRKMVMAAFGFRFSKMSQALLARMLKSVNKDSASVERTEKPVNTERGAESPVALANMPAKKSSSKRKELLKVLHEVTDVPLEDLNDDSTLEDLGIDSLMATEVLNDIRSVLGVTIDLTTFLFFANVKELIAHLDAKMGWVERTEKPVNTERGAESPVALANMPAKKSSSKRKELLKVLHEVTDVPLEDLNDDSTLEDLGIDSLMATEVLNDIRSVLGVTIDLTTFLFFANVKELIAHLDAKMGFSEEPSSGFSTPGEGTPTMLEDVSPSKGVVANGAPTSNDIIELIHSVPQSRPSITSAYDSFKGTRLKYDQLALGTKAVNFWSQVYPDQARLVLAYVVEAFADIGCDLKTLRPGESVPGIQPKTLPRHEKLVRQLYSVLEDGRLISAAKSGFVRTDILVDTTLAETLYQAIIPRYSESANVHELVKVIGSELAPCLTGEKDARQLIFGDRKNKHALEDMYANWPLLRTPTLVLGDFLLKAFTDATGSGKFRILEVGAGTGGTTKYIVELLQSYGIPFEYTFTDISSSLVSSARKTFKDVEEMRFELLDIEKPPIADHQGAYHVIIATNCIHATRNLDVSLRHLRQMLRDDGALTLVEITQNMFWLDIVVGLFEGWWLFEDGRSHALIDELHWQRLMKGAGFQDVLWSDGETPEAATVRVIGAFPSAAATTNETRKVKKAPKSALETVVYKKIGDQEIYADVYYPVDPPAKKLPVALMIHGGSHILFSRKDIRPAQTQLLLERGFLPVSLDHRLCPEVKLAEGPMVDVCDALDWVRNTLPRLKLQCPRLQVDGERVVAVGWSSGGQLAMSLAWTAPQKGLRPPEAILAFYCPTDYEDECKFPPLCSIV